MREMPFQDGIYHRMEQALLPVALRRGRWVTAACHWQQPEYARHCAALGDQRILSRVIALITLGESCNREYKLFAPCTSYFPPSMSLQECHSFSLKLLLDYR